MLLFLFACVMPLLDTPDDTITDSTDQLTYSVSKLDRSIDSSVKLVIKNGESRGHCSGNYFKYKRYKFIITAAHCVDIGEIWADDGIDILKTETLWVDPKRDIAIVRPMGELYHTKPSKFKINYDDNKVGSIIRYAGYPSGLGKMVFQGIIAKEDGINLVLQSFALPGSSGSIIFDKKGRAVAVLTAVAVEWGYFTGIPHLKENIVYSSRLDFMDRHLLKEILSRDLSNTVIKKDGEPLSE